MHRALEEALDGALVYLRDVLSVYIYGNGEWGLQQAIQEYGDLGHSPLAVGALWALREDLFDQVKEEVAERLEADGEE